MSEKPELFGTDGIRGVAGHYPLDQETLWKIGRALGTVLRERTNNDRAQVILGEDTRQSSAWISRMIAAGLRSSGVRINYAGVITTPGVAFLTRHYEFAAGVMVSASHNPFQDNGVKVLSSRGIKLPEADEIKVERALAESVPVPSSSREVALRPDPQFLTDYLDYLRSLVPPSLTLPNYKVVVDCANGASARVIPELLKRLGIVGIVLNQEPNGRNINLNCGSLHPESMAEATKASKSDLGVAFDGDADRAIFATREGRVADGDHVLFATAPHLHHQGRLKGEEVVGTLMSNGGLEIALARQGIGLRRTAVGDKYVLEEMLRTGINLGGEPSGHIIFSDLSLAGDGIITMLQILLMIGESQNRFEDLVNGLIKFPQVIRNVRVKTKPPLDSLPLAARAIDDCRKEIGDRGRVIVRYSGTEPLLRIMVEGEMEEAVELHARKIADAANSLIGVV